MGEAEPKIFNPLQLGPMREHFYDEDGYSVYKMSFHTEIFSITFLMANYAEVMILESVGIASAPNTYRKT